MRIHLITTPNRDIIPFDYQPKLVGTLNKWLGRNNDEHGNLSLYSFSWLNNGQITGNGFRFPNGAVWSISFYDEYRIKDIIRTIRESPDLFCGMFVTDVTIEETPDLSNRNRFLLSSPIHIQRSDGKNTRHFTFKDTEASNLMKETLERKMQAAGLDSDETLKIKFDLSYQQRKEKLVKYRNIKIKASMCPIIIEGTNVTKQFAWNVGVGNSTGIGFGSIY
jgi:CRISPR-associated endoribonuclease Cas6